MFLYHVICDNPVIIEMLIDNLSHFGALPLQNGRMKEQEHIEHRRLVAQPDTAVLCAGIGE